MTVRASDELERVAQAPKKFFKKAFGKNDHAGENPERLRLEAVALSQEYLAANGLDDIYIDARRYEPAEQWRRLKTNDRIAPFWKYTAGTLNVVGYTLLPRRALHSDVYSPFTNTLNINSVRPASALYQAARAKEYQKQHWLGTYAVLQHAPGIPLFHHANAASDALTYAQVSGQWDLTPELYATSYSHLGSAVVSDAMFFAPLPANAPPLATPIVKVAGRATGRMVGQYVAERQEATISAEMQAEAESPSLSSEDNQRPYPFRDGERVESLGALSAF